MTRHARLLIVVCLLISGVPYAGAQTLTVTSGFDGSSSPFIRSEMIVVSLTGAEPYRPFTILYGDPAPSPFLFPGVATGQLEVMPGTFEQFGPWDGLGLFGSPSPFLTDGNGDFSASVLIPVTFPSAGLPFQKTFQAISLVSPLTSPGGEFFALSVADPVVIDEPLTNPTITEITPHVILEGGGPPVVLTIRGTGFLQQATVLPSVTFNSTCNPGASAPGTVLQVIPDPVTPGEAALLVQAPTLIGAATLAPATNSGPVRVTISYQGTGLYPNVGVGQPGVSTTPIVGEADPRSLVYQTSVMPIISDIDPKANPTTGGCPITITGSGFLNCASVVFNPGPSEVVVDSSLFSSFSDTQIQLSPPALSEALVPVVVRNVDHLSTSPRESAVNPPVTDFAYFLYDASQLVVTSVVVEGGVDASSLTEGDAAVTMVVTGTCQTVGGYSLLDAEFGSTGVRMGANTLGMDADLLVTGAVEIDITSPGNWKFKLPVPALPAGIAFNPPAPSSGGLTNTGRKHIQIIPPACVSPNGVPLPHKTYTAIPAQETSNLLNYLSAAPPEVTHFLANNCGRADGGQTILLKGSGFLSQGMALPSSDPLAIPAVVLLGDSGDLLSPTSVTMLDETTIEIVTPDITPLAFELPYFADVSVTNPDQQHNDTTGANDDFFFLPSLSGTIANNFSLAGPTVLVDTTTAPAGAPITYTFTGDLTLPLGLTLQATGEHPLIIRVRGNVVIDGDIDLTGGTVTSGLFLVPAGAGAGGPAANLLALAAEDPLQGMFGLNPIDPLTGLAFPNPAAGGFHGLEAGGGGGAGMLLAGAAGVKAEGAGGPGGEALGFVVAPLPVLGIGDPTETGYPPGGAGGGAGGLGTLPLLGPLPVADDVGQNGAGGQGGGGLIIAADGTITVNGSLIVNGQDGANGAPSLNLPVQGGGGGGGGSGGSIVLQSLHGIFINNTAVLTALGGAGGLAGVPPGDGGAGSRGMIRLAIPAQSGIPDLILQMDGVATVEPGADTTSYQP